MLTAGIGLAMAGCSGGGATGSQPVTPPPSSAHTAAEQVAVMKWLLKTNQMWTNNDFAGLDQVTDGQMSTIYQFGQRQVSPPKNASRAAFQLTGLSITIPCRTGAAAVFVAYADTDVFDLWWSVQSVAMVFERVGGLWKLGRRRRRRPCWRRAAAPLTWSAYGPASTAGPGRPPRGRNHVHRPRAPSPRPDVRAAAGQQPRLLDHRHSQALDGFFSWPLTAVAS